MKIQPLLSLLLATAVVAVLPTACSRGNGSSGQSPRETVSALVNALKLGDTAQAMSYYDEPSGVFEEQALREAVLGEIGTLRNGDRVTVLGERVTPTFARVGMRTDKRNGAGVVDSFSLRPVNGVWRISLQ